LQKHGAAAGGGVDGVFKRRMECWKERERKNVVEWRKRKTEKNRAKGE
jgi:hypothetical protein